MSSIMEGSSDTTTNEKKAQLDKFFQESGMEVRKEIGAYIQYVPDQSLYMQIKDGPCRHEGKTSAHALSPDFLPL